MSKPDMKGWSPEQIKAYEQALAAREEARAKMPKGPTPEELIAQLDEERELLEREAEDEAAYKAAVRKYGGKDRVMRIRTLRRSVILRALSRKEWRDHMERFNALDSDADKDRLAEQTVYDSLVHPTRAELDELLELFPALWTPLYGARDALIHGLAEAARGKG